MYCIIFYKKLNFITQIFNVNKFINYHPSLLNKNIYLNNLVLNLSNYDSLILSENILLNKINSFYVYGFFLKKKNLIYWTNKSMFFNQLSNIGKIIYNFFNLNKKIFFFSSNLLLKNINIINSYFFNFYFIQQNNFFFTWKSQWMQNSSFFEKFTLFFKSLNFKLIVLFDTTSYRFNFFFFLATQLPIIALTSLNLNSNPLHYPIIIDNKYIINFYIIYNFINKIFIFSYLFKNFLKFINYYKLFNSSSNYLYKFIKIHNFEPLSLD